MASSQNHFDALWGRHVSCFDCVLRDVTTVAGREMWLYLWLLCMWLHLFTYVAAGNCSCTHGCGCDCGCTCIYVHGCRCAYDCMMWLWLRLRLCAQKPQCINCGRAEEKLRNAPKNACAWM